MASLTDRELTADAANPLEMDGIEFVEYATSQPLALANVLQMMGFAPIARHRSREVTLFRQGPMNIIVNAHPEALTGMTAPGARPVLSAIALLSAFGRGGLFGDNLSDAGIVLPFTEWAVVLAVLFVASPFYLRQAITAFEGVDQTLVGSSVFA